MVEWPLREFKTKIGNIRWHNQPPELIDYDARFTGDDKGSLLTLLDDFNRVWTHMRKFDPGAYQLFQRVGCRILPEHALTLYHGNIFDHLSVTELPGFGCYAIRRRASDDGNVYPVCCYINRLSVPPPHVQAAEGVIYSCGILYQDSRDDWSALAHIYFALQHNGKYQLLKERQVSYLRGYIPQRRWDFDRITKLIFEKRRPDESDSIHERARPWLNQILHNCAIPAIIGGVQVRCTKGPSTAVIAMTDNDAKHMFPPDERISGVAADGRSKRIWHFNRGWTDINGKVVPPHFKGLRDFEWNGWRINIRHDIKPAMEAAIGLTGGIEVDDSFQDTEKKYLDGEDVGVRIRNAIHSITTKQINKALKRS